jgi:hypothetical protein
MYAQIGPYQITFDPLVLLTRYRGEGYWLLDRFYEGAPIIGGPAGLALLCSINSIFHTERLFRGVFLIIAALALGILALSVSRGAILASGFAILVLLARPRRVLVLAALCVVGLLAFRIAIEYIPSATVRYSTMFSAVEDASLAERVDLWREYIAIALRDPLGQGFSFRVDGYSTHNEILGHWVAAGLFGVFGYLVFLLHWLVRGVGDATSMSFLVFFSLAGLVESYSVSSGTLIYPIFWLLATSHLMNLDQSARRTPFIRAELVSP